jgi:hypothetical protein
MMDWKKYEEEIETHFRSEYPSAQITRNARIHGRLSSTLREIDLLIEAQVCDLPFRIVIDAKYHNRKIDVKDVEEFLGLVRDVGAHKGLMISTEGYSEAAIHRASADDADVILDVLNFDELAQFQAFGAIPHAGSNAALLPAPFGWVIDATRRPGTLTWLYQQGLTIEEALKAHEFMYVNFWNKENKQADEIPDLPALLKFQESYIREGAPDAQITFIEASHRKDAETTIRCLRCMKYAGATEYTGFVDFKDFIFMCVLFTPDPLADKNLSKLRFVMRKVLPLKVTQKSATLSATD